MINFVDANDNAYLIYNTVKYGKCYNTDKYGKCYKTVKYGKKGYIFRLYFLSSKAPKFVI